MFGANLVRVLQLISGVVLLALIRFNVTSRLFAVVLIVTGIIELLYVVFDILKWFYKD